MNKYQVQNWNNGIKAEDHDNDDNNVRSLDFTSDMFVLGLNRQHLQVAAAGFLVYKCPQQTSSKTEVLTGYVR